MLICENTPNLHSIAHTFLPVPTDTGREHERGQISSGSTQCAWYVLVACIITTHVRYTRYDPTCIQTTTHTTTSPGNKCLYRTIDWWTYEVCYQQHVRQFHNDPATNTLASEYLLGNYDAAGDQGQVEVGSSGVGLLGGGAVGLQEGQVYKYVAQHYTNGEACDVTDRPRPRITEVGCVGLCLCWFVYGVM